MDKNSFAVDHHYTVTLREAGDKLRPANLYVHQLADAYMIARRTDGTRSGLLFKINYDDIQRVVKELDVVSEKRFQLPQALLHPKIWAERDVFNAYASGPGLGK